ncbi:hypothetical protein NEILACOT_04452 [Neisseria lactamica ATCC 23970]|uniref:Uncharacterized protein n=1 Tax=Neisseria lactamica ATCC 23970 TaxID=546265 RepID=D0WA83_NEILA|nr:hypothetical protein NEILACOT_04452 [Neisseria lactamica ATCC 23970]
MNPIFRLNGAVGYEYPIYSFQTAYQIIVRTVHKKPSFPRRRESRGLMLLQFKTFLQYLRLDSRLRGNDGGW